MSFGVLFVQAIGSGNDHVKHDGEGDGNDFWSQGMHDMVP
jgi:hypothetical protein